MPDQGIFFNPRTDYGFKMLFGQEESKIFLKSFLNALFDGEFVISEVEYRDKENLARIETERDAIYDIFCTTDTGHHLIIEMQNARQANFSRRCQWYLAQGIVGQASKGRWLYDLKPVFGIFFMNFEIPSTAGRLVTKVYPTVMETGEVFDNQTRMYMINLMQAKKLWVECENDTERWGNIIKYLETMEEIPYKAILEEDDRIMDNVWSELEEYARIHNLDSREMEKYQYSLDRYYTALAVRESAVQEGYADGLEQGMQKGMQKGLQQGTELGRKSALRESVLNMRALGFDDATIEKALQVNLSELDL